MSDKRLLIKLAADVEGLKAGMRQANKSVDDFQNKITGMAKLAGAAFSIQQIGSYVLEVSKLAAEAEGVEIAFRKLPNSVRLMHDLKEATHGTVSELDLMKRAVQFSNFNLSLKELPKLLQFATLRAQQTGQSVDYLVDSIVTGLGRKSVLILDNLGLSSAMINEEVAKTGDFMTAVGTIVDTELAKMGTVMENNMTRTERFNASLVNMNVYLGNAANGTGLLGQAFAQLTSKMDVASSTNLSFWEKLAAMSMGPGVEAASMMKNIALEQKKLQEEQKKGEQVVREVDRAFSEWGDNLEGYKKTITQHIYYEEILAEITRRLTEEEKKKALGIENIANLTARLNELQQMQQTLTGTHLANTNIEIKQIQDKIKALQELGVVESKNLSRAGAAIRPTDTLSLKTTDKQGSAVDALLPESASLLFNERVMKAQLALRNLALTQKISFDQMMAKSLEYDEQQARSAELMETAALSIGASIGSVVSGQQNGLQAIASITNNIVQQFARQAIAAAIANAAKAGGPFPFASVVLAGTAAAAMSALLNKVGARGSYGGGGSGMSGGGASAGAGGGIINSQLGDRINLVGEFTVRGPNLVAAIDNQNRVDNRTKFG